jgi:PHD/YefM family antitoxin component YafN of YafNO toxin-antitoxin module
MALDLSSIHSLSDFQRRAKYHVRKLKKSGEPAILTVNGQAEVVVQSAAAYQELLDTRELLDTIRGISRGLEQAQRGEGRPMREFLQALAKDHGIDLADHPRTPRSASTPRRRGVSESR